MDHILKAHEILPADFVRGENCYLYDRQGRQYTDFESGTWAAVLGHNHPRITQVLHTQIDRIMHLGTRWPNHLAEEAAKDVLAIVGLGDGKCVFLSSGSEAVEFAARMARRVTERPLLLAFSNAYLAAFGSAGQKSADEWLLVDWSTDPLDVLLKSLDAIPFEKIGAFVLEPGGSSPGFVRFPPAPLVQEIARRVRQAGGLLVVNEVTTGMGRTGRWFGFEHYGLQPDLVALGKGLGNGYPVSAVALKPAVAESLENSGVRYAQSHQNDPLGCAVAREVIAVMREMQWVERGNAVGTAFLDSLNQLRTKYPVIKEARGRGMLLALEFQPHERISATSMFRALWENGFLTGYYPAGNILRFDPALTMDQQDIDRLLDCLEAQLQSPAG